MLPTLQPLLVGLLLGAQLVYTSPAGSTNLNRRANPPDIPDFERLYDGPLPPEPTNADDEYISCIAKWCHYQAAQETQSPNPTSAQARQAAFNYGEGTCFTLTQARWNGQVPARRFAKHELDQVIEDYKSEARTAQGERDGTSDRRRGRWEDTDPLMMQVGPLAGIGGRRNVFGMGMDRVNSLAKGVKLNVQGWAAAPPKVNLHAVAAAIRHNGWVPSMPPVKNMGWAGRPAVLR